MMSRPPSVSVAAPTKRSAKPGLVTSPLMATASPPAALISAATASPGPESRSLTASLAPCWASFSAIARPEPETSATFPSKLLIRPPQRSQRDDRFAGELDVASLVPGGEREPGAALAVRLEEFRDRPFAGDRRAELGDGYKTGREGAQPIRRHGVGHGLAEQAHDQHAVGENVGEAGLLGEIAVDVDRVVIAGRPCVEGELGAGDGGKRLGDDRVANLRIIEPDGHEKAPNCGRRRRGHSLRPALRAGWS